MGNFAKGSSRAATITWTPKVRQELRGAAHRTLILLHDEGDNLWESVFNSKVSLLIQAMPRWESK